MVLYDQTSNIGGAANSQDYETSNNAYDNQGADDFVVTGSGWNVTTVFAPGVYFPSNITVSPASMRVVFYKDAAGIPGATICDFPALPYAEAPRGSFTIAIPGGCLLTPGTKWVSVIANLSSAPGGGSWDWSTRTVLTGNPSMWRNPNNGFKSCPVWFPRATCFGQVDPDFAFRLDGIANCTTDAHCDDGNACNGIETCAASVCSPGSPIVCDDGQFCTIDSCVPATGQCTTAPNPCADDNTCNTDTCDEVTDTCAHNGAAVRICKSELVTIPRTGSPAGPAAPYPSVLEVEGLPTPSSLCAVELLEISHTWRGDVDIMLVSPLGGNSNRTILSDVGGSGQFNNTDLTLSDAAATSLPTTNGYIASGFYKPTNAETIDAFEAPAPGETGLAPLWGFDGIDPNGPWSLFVRDDFSLANGNLTMWCLNFIAANCTNDATCSDGNLCTGVETCSAGNCVAGTSVNCDDGQFCTSDACNPATAACTHGPMSCADNDSCTADTCDETSDSCDNLPIAQPGEITTLSVGDPNKNTISWTLDGASTAYDVLRGFIGTLPVGPGGGDEFCTDDHAASSLLDVSIPASGQGYWYLVRGVGCVNGPYGNSTAGPRVTTTCN